MTVMLEQMISKGLFQAKPFCDSRFYPSKVRPLTFKTSNTVLITINKFTCIHRILPFLCSLLLLKLHACQVKSHYLTAGQKCKYPFLLKKSYLDQKENPAWSGEGKTDAGHKEQGCPFFWKHTQAHEASASVQQPILYEFLRKKK